MSNLLRLLRWKRVVESQKRDLHEADRRSLLQIMPINAVVAEIGVWKGDFSDLILKVTTPRRLHLIDPWTFASDLPDSWYGGSDAKSQQDMDKIYGVVRRRLNPFVQRGVVSFHRDSSAEVSKNFADEYFDWIYVDGNHLYEYVLEDLTYYFPKLRPGGYLCGDDYGEEGWWFNGVQRAVDEFSSLRGIGVDLIGTQFVLQKPATLS